MSVTRRIHASRPADPGLASAKAWDPLDAAAGSRLPANLGGDIYAALMDRNDIAPIERTLAAFIVAI